MSDSSCQTKISKFASGMSSTIRYFKQQLESEQRTWKSIELKGIIEGLERAMTEFSLSFYDTSHTTVKQEEQ